MGVLTSVIKEEDPKYDKINNTYNGKSLDANNSGSVDIGDGVVIINAINKDTIRQYFGGTISLDYSDSDTMGIIRDYYNRHNYEWPTLDQIKYYKTNGAWPEEETN